ncbi:MAG: hypothetical protein ACKV2T_03480 [Kofleriaceae bacterium]
MLVVFGVAFVPAIAEAGRKRVVVLDLEGPKAEKFHEGLVKLLKKTHTVVPTEKWTSTADDLGANKLTDGNIKKIAKKLKIDAVVTGKIEKRRDEYIIQLKIRAGKTGAVTGSRIDTSSERGMIDAKASRDLKDELVSAIDTMKSGRGGDDEEEEEEERPKKKVAARDDEEEEEEEEKPKKKGFGKKSSNDDEEEEEEEEEDKPSKKELAAKKKKEEEERKKEEAEAKAEAKKEEERRKKEEALAKKEEEKRKKDEAKKKAKKDADEEEEEEEEDETAAALKTKKDSSDEEEEEEEEDEPKKKKVAARDGDEEEVEESSVEASAEDGDEDPDKLSVGERAVEAIAGISFNARRMKFTYEANLENHPPPYNGVPVAGLVLDVTVFPLAITHKNKSMLKNIGLTAMYDKVLLINSKSDPDGPGGNAPVTLPTSQSRWSVGGVFRYPLSKMITVGGQLEYGKQTFTIRPASGVSPGIPNTAYTAIAPTVFARLSLGKLVVSVDATYLAIGKAGQIENNDQYGPASKNGFEGQLSVDYMLKKFLFARVAFRGAAIGFAFNGTGAMATNRDLDPEKDVFGASDKYFGGIATVGYLY